MSPAARRSPQRTIKGSICIFPRGDNSISMNLMSICGGAASVDTCKLTLFKSSFSTLLLMILAMAL